VFRSERSLLVFESRISDALPNLIEPAERLAVQHVTYGSKGFKDLAGIGVVIGHLKDFIIHLIDLYATKPQRELDNVHRQLENDRLRIENAERLVDLTQKLGYSKIERRQFVNAVLHEQQHVEHLISLGKITSVEQNGDQQL
jgi:hypothetical protein